MMMKNIYICIICLLILSGFNSVFAVTAFPGAEGEGRWATGSRGGTVYEVNNLTNSGPGSIVDALSAGNRTIVFRVSGTIPLGDVILEPKSNTTIAGQTAPGDGICIKGRIHFVSSVHDIIIRYIRVRVDAGGANSSGDAIDIDSCNNVIIDHVSASYSRDEGISCQQYSNNITVQRCIISEALNYQTHSYGSLVRGQYGQEKTYHHNLYAHNRGRNPRPGNYLPVASDSNGLHFDFRNNVVYNWAGSTAGYNDDYNNPPDSVTSVSRYNFIGNAYIKGLDSSGSFYAFRERSSAAYGYFLDNSSEGVVPGDQWTLVNLQNLTEAQRVAYKARSYLIPMEPVTTTSPALAKIDVLADAGASFPTRDTVDTRIVNNVLTKTGRIIKYTGTGDPNDHNEPPPPGGWWPTLNSLPAPTDTDQDGMPDEWEEAVCLDSEDASDRNSDRDGDGYTNLEEYLNWLPLGEPMPANTDINCDDIVNFYDFSEFAQHWSSADGEPLYDEKYDFSHNGAIAIGDLLYIAQDWLTAGQEY
jgi:pectate lyase